MAWYRPKKQTTDNLLQINIKNIRKSGLFEDNAIKEGSIHWEVGSPENAKSSINFKLDTTTSDKYLELRYLCNDVATMYQIPLEMTQPNYGGVRWWFRCPGCGRRVTNLYIKQRFFWCRKCNDLTYRSQQYSFYDRMRLMYKKYENLAQKDGFKRKGMHWSTYCALMDKANDYEITAEIPLMKRLCKISGINYMDLI